jgi:sulfur carrier protein
MRVTVNGEDVQIDGEVTTVAELLETRGFPHEGIAVAVNWEVLPRSEWHLAVPDGAKLEIVTAVQGG